MCSFNIEKKHFKALNKCRDDNRRKSLSDKILETESDIKLYIHK